MPEGPVELNGSTVMELQWCSGTAKLLDSIKLKTGEPTDREGQYWGDAGTDSRLTQINRETPAI